MEISSHKDQTLCTLWHICSCTWCMSFVYFKYHHIDLYVKSGTSGMPWIHSYHFPWIKLLGTLSTEPTPHPYIIHFITLWLHFSVQYYSWVWVGRWHHTCDPYSDCYVSDYPSENVVQCFPNYSLSVSAVYAWPSGSPAFPKRKGMDSKLNWDVITQLSYQMQAEIKKLKNYCRGYGLVALLIRYTSIGNASFKIRNIRTERRMDRHYQTYYLPCFAVDNKESILLPLECHIEDRNAWMCLECREGSYHWNVTLWAEMHECV